MAPKLRLYCSLYCDSGPVSRSCGGARSKGFAYVLFTDPESAVSAAKSLDGQIFQGRLLHVLAADRPPTAGASEHDEGANRSNPGLKQQRLEARKADAGNRSAWNTLFVRADTVAAAVAEHYGMSKSEMLARDASDLGARLALGEAQIIAKTKEALGNAGGSLLFHWSAWCQTTTEEREKEQKKNGHIYFGFKRH